MKRHRGHPRQEECDDDKSGQGQDRRPGQSEAFGERREHQRSEREPERAAGDVDRHRESGPIATEPVRQRRRRRMKRRRPEAAGNQNRRQHRRRCRRADETQNRDRDHRADHHQQAWPPAVGEPSKADLRDRRRHLKAHGQCAGSDQRQAELGDEQRQQRRVDVPVAVDHHVGAGHQQDGRMESKASHVSGVPSVG